jgi:hypothetical protein
VKTPRWEAKIGHKKRAAVIQKKFLKTAQRGRLGDTENGKISAVGVAYIIEITVAHAVWNRHKFGTEKVRAKTHIILLPRKEIKD